MRFLVKLGTRRYLRAEDEGADELWNDVMERWFYNELYKVSNNMLIYNRRQREVGNPQLAFDWIDVELQNGQLHALLHCDNVSGIRPETSELLTQLRAAYNEGALGEDVVRAYLPAPASYEEQKAAGLAAKAERDAQKAAELAAAEEEARAAAAAAEAAAEGVTMTQHALRWALAQPGVVSALVGVKREELLDEVTIGGVATYMNRADNANVNLFI